MKVTIFHIESFRGIKRLDLDQDEITVPVGENNTGKTGVLDDPCARPPGHRPAPGRPRRTMVSWEGP